MLWCVFIQLFGFDIKLSNSIYFPFNKLKANAPAEAVKTEKSNAPFIPVEKVIDKANINKRIPLNFANNSVLNPTNKHKAKTISAVVAIIPIAEIIEFGNQGFINSVYSKKLLQFPQAEISLLLSPNLSATEDKNPTEMASLKNSLGNLSVIFMSFNLFFDSVFSI